MYQIICNLHIFSLFLATSDQFKSNLLKQFINSVNAYQVKDKEKFFVR